MNNKRQSKLIAAIMVFAVAFAAVALAIPTSDATSTYTETVTVNGVEFNINFDDTNLNISKVEGDTVYFTGVVNAGELNGNSSKFDGPFPGVTGFGAMEVGFDEKSSKYFVWTEQTNSALKAAYPSSFPQGIKKSTSDNDNDRNYKLYSFLIPKDSGSVVQIDFYKITSSENYDSIADNSTAPATKELIGKIKLDFSEVSTKINLSGTMQSHDYVAGTSGWNFASGTLTLKNYDGRELFYNNTASEVLKVKLIGENYIDAYGGCAISGSGGLHIGADTGGDASLSITQNAQGGYGLFSPWNKEMQIGNTDKRTTISSEGGNRAIYATGDEANFDIINSDVTVTASERSIRSEGALVVSNGSVINAYVDDTLAVNGAGDDDIMGIKVKAIDISANSKVTTQGLRITGADGTDNPVVPALKNAGILIIDGDYLQNPSADMAVKISGLYLDSATATAQRVTSAGSTTGTIYLLGDTETYGKVTVGTNEVVVDVSTNDSATKVNTVINGSADKYTIINPSTSAVDGIIVPAGKEVEITIATNATSGKIYTGSSDSGNYVELSSFKGALKITENSIDIEGDINEGTLTVFGQAKLTGPVTIDAGATLTINAGATLDMGGYEITVGNSTGGATMTVNGTVISTGTIDLVNVDSTLNINGSTSSSPTVTGLGEIAFNGAVIDGSITVKNALIQGSITSGTVLIDRNAGDTDDLRTVTASAAIVFGEKTKVVIPKDRFFDNATFPVENRGLINVTGTIKNSSGVITNDGTITLLDKDASIPGDIVGNGLIDMGAISSEATFSGDLETVTTYGKHQIVTVVADTTFVAGTKITIEGKLIINDGVTLTIESGAQLVISNAFAILENNGTIVVASDVASDPAVTEVARDGTTPFTASGGLVVFGAKVNNYGTLIAGYVLETNESGSKTSITIGADSNLNNYGTIQISKDNTISTVANVNNKAEAIITVNGTLTVSTGAVNNEGTINIDGACTTTINQKADGAAVNIISTTGSITITDDELKTSKIYVDGSTVKANQVVIGPSSGNTNTEVSGISIVTTVTKNVDTTSTYENNMILSGAVTISKIDSTGADAAASIALTGERVIVSETMSIAEDVVVSGATLTVDGEMTAVNGNDITVANVIVDGKLTTGKNPVTGNVTGALYIVQVTTPTVSNTYYYSNVETAVAGAVAAGVKLVTVTGNVKVSSDVEIPANLVLKQQSGTMTVAADKTVTVAVGGKIDQTAGAIIDVEGTVYVAGKATGLSRNIVINSEVKSEGEKDVRYTTLAGAIAAAGTDEVTIKLNDDTKITKDLIIPKNVTVDTNGKDFEVNGAKLTIDGTLYLNGSAYSVTDDTSNPNVKKTGAVVITGSIKSDMPMTYDNKKYPAGAYYESEGYYYITSVANAPAVIADAEDQTVTIWGKVEVTDLDFVGTADKPLTVRINNTDDGKDFVAGTISIDYTTLVLASGRNVTATIAGPTGSVDMDTVNIISEVKFIASEDSDANATFTATGAMGAQTGKADSYGLTVIDKVVLKDMVLNATVGDDTYNLTVDGEAVLTGSVVIGTLLVNGTANIENESTATVTIAIVLGTLVAAEATENRSAGSAIVTTLYAGLTKDDTLIGASAAITGNVTVSGVSYIADGTDIPAKMIEGKKSIEFYVEGALWMTAYAVSGNAIVSDAPVPNAQFLGWAKGEDKAVEKDGSNNVLTSFAFGTYTKLYAKVNYDIYKIKLLANEGIADVFIDGNLMVKENGTYETKVSAGVHKIEYTLKNGYSGDAKLYINGEVQSGLSFTTEGDFDSVGTSNTYNLQLSGIEKSGYTPEAPDTSGEKDGMSLVEILLIVLVVLILIMAIIVALRLMRS